MQYLNTNAVCACGESKEYVGEYRREVQGAKQTVPWQLSVAGQLAPPLHVQPQNCTFVVLLISEHFALGMYP